MIVPLWRGGLLPLGREAAPKPATVVIRVNRVRWLYDCFAAERGQAPSPQDQGRLQSSFFINPANAANGLCVALAIFGVLSEPSSKYC